MFNSHLALKQSSKSYNLFTGIYIYIHTRTWVRIRNIYLPNLHHSWIKILSPDSFCFMWILTEEVVLGAADKMKSIVSTET